MSKLLSKVNKTLYKKRNGERERVDIITPFWFKVASCDTFVKSTKKLVNSQKLISQIKSVC